MTIVNNIVDIAKYQVQQPIKLEKPTHLPLIYAVHSPLGEPLILFRFIKAEDTTKSAEVISLSQYKTARA